MILIKSITYRFVSFLFLGELTTETGVFRQSTKKVRGPEGRLSARRRREIEGRPTGAPQITGHATVAGIPCVQAAGLCTREAKASRLRADQSQNRLLKG